MADWKVAREEIKLFSHPNAEKLEVARVGDFSLVVQKGLYKDGDTVVFVPRRSILPDHLAEPFRAYLSGPEKNRVKEVRLRGELSQGVTLPLDVIPESLRESPLGEDISKELGIIEYIVPIPAELMGQVTPVHHMVFSHFDVDNYRIFSDEIFEGEEVVATEKIHSTQVNFLLRNEEVYVSSKGLLRQGLALKESESNTYWKAVRNVGLEGLVRTFAEPDVTYQVVGEATPVQGGYNYGQKQPTVFVFEFRINGRPVAFDDVPEVLKTHWVPVLYRGGFSEAKMSELAKGNETISGQEKHIREGLVIQPLLPRRNSQGDWLRLKFINPAYAKHSTGEELN